MTSELHELLAGDRRDGGESTRNDYPNPYFASYDVKLHGLTSTQVVIPAGEDRDVGDAGMQPLRPLCTRWLSDVGSNRLL